jgi:hypothetical protein
VLRPMIVMQAPGIRRRRRWPGRPTRIGGHHVRSKTRGHHRSYAIPGSGTGHRVGCARRTKDSATRPIRQPSRRSSSSCAKPDQAPLRTGTRGLPRRPRSRGRRLLIVDQHDCGGPLKLRAGSLQSVCARLPIPVLCGLYPRPQPPTPRAGKQCSRSAIEPRPGRRLVRLNHSQRRRRGLVWSSWLFSVRRRDSTSQPRAPLSQFHGSGGSDEHRHHRWHCARAG